MREALREVLRELDRATSLHGPMHSAHEGWAVLREEVDELWHEVKHGTEDAMREEAVQVAAMALRFLVDVGGLKLGSPALCLAGKGASRCTLPEGHAGWHHEAWDNEGRGYTWPRAAESHTPQQEEVSRG